MHGLVKTNKVDNLVTPTTNGCRTTAENLTIILQTVNFLKSKIESRVQNTSEMLNFIDYLSHSNILTENCMSVFTQ